jgi:catabolite regulation protein CreA
MKVFSYDLSAATDRFPIDLQVQILSMLYTKEVALAWKSVLVNRDYHFKDNTYRYSVGQPMGALSS